jgi:hypothetical protein
MKKKKKRKKREKKSKKQNKTKQKKQARSWVDFAETSLSRFSSISLVPANSTQIHRDKATLILVFKAARSTPRKSSY